MSEQNITYFSIVTVTKNNHEGLKKTYKSLLAQDSFAFEWIVIDGDSDDGSAAWIQSISPGFQGFSWVSEPDFGIFDAMNKGIAKSRGLYVLFLNAGDILFESNVLKKLEKAIASSHKPDFIFGDCYEEMAEGGKFYKPAKPVSAIRTGMITHHQAMLYKRELLDGLNYNLNYKLAADYDFTVRFLERAGRSLHCAIPICTFQAGGVSQIYADKARLEEFQIRKVLRVCGAAQNHFNYWRQSLALFIRRQWPWLYQRLRHRDVLGNI